MNQKKKIAYQTYSLLNYSITFYPIIQTLIFKYALLSQHIVLLKRNKNSIRKLFCVKELKIFDF